MKSITVRGVRIGEGIPKIIAPIVGRTEQEILAQAEAIAASGADIAEWRIDHYENGSDADFVHKTAADIHNILHNIPLLITFRTQNEGGAQAIEPQDYALLLQKICRSGCADMIDTEAFIGAEEAQAVIRCARECGVCAVASNHDFSATPDEEEILRRLRHMRDIGADIAKIAVMPQNNLDVLTLLRATARAAAEMDCPLITMSMGGTGAVSRIAGECFGSACTFGSVGEASAPGQMPVHRLRAALETLHGNPPQTE